MLGSGGWLWIAANDLETEGVFKFVDAEGTLDFFNWDQYHYNYGGGVTPDNRDCIRLYVDFGNKLTMCDYDCYNTGYMNPLCEANLV